MELIILNMKMILINLLILSKLVNIIFMNILVNIMNISNIFLILILIFVLFLGNLIKKFMVIMEGLNIFLICIFFVKSLNETLNNTCLNNDYIKKYYLDFI